MLKFEPLVRGADAGFLPSFLSITDSRPAREQFDTSYIAGWSPFDGFSFDPESHTLSYPDDPVLTPIAVARLRDERIFLYRYAWVAIVQPDNSFEVARLD